MSSRILIRVTSVLVASLLGGCGSLLPKVDSETDAPWKTFEEAKRTYDGIVPGQTTLAELKQAGFDPYLNRNVTVLHFSDVVAKFAPSAVRDEHLEPGIRECLQRPSMCSAYAMEHRQIHRKRVGNFFLDFINYRRRTEITGWRFSAVIVIVGERVVHKSWNGVPVISEVEETTNPLGPLQDSGPSIIRGW